MAGGVIILERMFRDPDRTSEAIDFCSYLKSIVQKVTVLYFASRLRLNLSLGELEH